MTTYLGKSCSFDLPRVPFVNCRQFMYLVISLLVLRAGCGFWLYQFLIIAYLFTVMKSIRDGIICLFSLPSLSKYLFSAAILSIKRFQCLIASVSSARCSFVLLNFAPNTCARLDGWKTLKLPQLQQIIFVLFEIYIRKLIMRIESWLWSFHEGMNGITRTFYAHHTKMCASVISFIPSRNDQNQLSVLKCQ